MNPKSMDVSGASETAEKVGGFLKTLITLKDKLAELEKKTAQADELERTFVLRVLQIIKERQILVPENEARILEVPSKLEALEKRIQRIEQMFDAVLQADHRTTPAPQQVVVLPPMPPMSLPPTTPTPRKRARKT